RLLGREEARADHRLLTDEHRWQHGCESRRRDVVERKAIERKSEQRGVADDVAEPRPEAADLDRVVLGVSVRCRVMGWVRYEGKRLLSGGLGGCQLLLR